MVNSLHRCKKSKNIVSLHLYPSLGTCYLTMNMMRSQQEVRYRKAWFLHQLPSSPPQKKKTRIVETRLVGIGIFQDSHLAHLSTVRRTGIYLERTLAVMKAAIMAADHVRPNGEPFGTSVSGVSRNLRRS